MISNAMAGMTVDECKEHYDGMIKKLGKSAERQGLISLLCLIASIITFFMGVDKVGVTLLIVATYFWQEANRAEAQANVVVAVYPLLLLLNRYGSQESQKVN
jgi:hypothetical protein